MPGRNNKSEGMHERNDSLVIVKADGGLVVANDVYQEFGELHSDKDGVTIDIQNKIPILKPTIIGRPPIQDRMVYYVDEDGQDCGFDPFYMYGKLKSAYNLSRSNRTQDADANQKHKRNMDMMFTVAGGCVLLFALFLAPLMGFSLKINQDEAPPPPAPRTTTIEEGSYAWTQEGMRLLHLQGPEAQEQRQG